MQRSISLLLLLILIGAQPAAFAYYSVMDTGEIMQAGRSKLTPELQFNTQDGGANADADFDFGLTEDSGIRGQAGGGDTNFYLGGFYKFMPFPDIDGQPAIGFNTGLIYANDNAAADLTVRFEPLISKRFNVDFGAITPYGSIPIAWQHRSAATYANDHDNLVLQAVVGGQLDLKTIPNVGLMAEVGIDLYKAFGYFSVGAAWTFGTNVAKTSSED